MNHEKRKQTLQLIPFLDKLEPRRLMSLGVAKARPEHDMVQLAAALESQVAARDWGAFAVTLAEHPRVAADLGLGGLSRSLRKHAVYADRNGWSASLVRELKSHPKYAAAHHLTAALTADQAPPTGAVKPPTKNVATKTNSVSRTGATASTSRTIPTKTTLASQNVAVVTPDLTALQKLENAFAKAAASQPTPPALVAPTPTAPITPTPPSVVVNDPLSVGVGGALDVTLPNLGLGSSGLTFTITPQPLPDNVTFNRQTGELVFMPATGQQGDFDFSVMVSNGSQNGLITVPITVTAPALSSTKLSGQVVDENGDPLPNMPVTIGGISTVTDSSGNFTLTNVPANPGPISAGGPVGTEQGRLDLTAPVAQLLGHDLYNDADNVIPSPLILPMINWSTAASFSQAPSATSVNITTPAMAGLSIQMPASASAVSAVTGAVQVAQLSAALSAQHMAQGMSGGLLLLNITGTGLSSAVQLTLPNTQGFQPGAVVYLTMFNSVTGGHDVVGQLVVSDDGETMTSTGPIKLSSSGGTTGAGSTALVAPDAAGGVSADASSPFSGYTVCLGDQIQNPTGTPTSLCNGCQTLADPSGSSGGSSSSSSSSSTSPSGPGGIGMGGPMGTPGGIMVPAGVMDSNAGLITGEYFLNNPLATYQAQGQTLGISLQYSSAQADPTPVVQYQFTTPLGGDSSSISSINAQVSLAGVLQGDPTAYCIPEGGLADGTTYDIPLQVDASELPTGVYAYAMTVTETFGTGDDEVSVTSTDEGSVNVVNESSGQLGAGWSIGGLQQLSQLTTDGPVLITAGQQGTEAFQSAYNDGQSYLQDLAIATSASSPQILPNDGAGEFSASVSAADSVIGTAAGIFTGDGEQDLVLVTSSGLQIELNNGSGGFSAGESGSIPSGYEAKGVVVGNFSGHDNSDLDIAVLLAATSGAHEYSVAVYIGTGSGTFGSGGTEYALGTPVISAAGNGDASGPQPDSIASGGFTGGTDDDIVFTTDDGLLDEMVHTTGGAMGSATSVTLASGTLAIGVTTVDYNGSGLTDVVVEAENTNVEEDSLYPFVSLEVLSNDGSGDFSETSFFQTVGQANHDILGLVAGAFQGPSMGLEIAVPVSGESAYVDIVQLSSSGELSNGVLHSVGAVGDTGGSVTSDYAGNIIAADFNGAGEPGIALADGGTDQILLLLPDIGSNQFLPMAETIATGSTNNGIGMLAVAPFIGTAASVVYRGPTSDPSTLAQNADGSWTRTYPDGTVIQFNASGQETSESDRNGNTFTYAYVTSGPATGALATITDPVGLVTTLAYDEYGHISTSTNPDGFVTNLAVDGYGNLTEVEDPLGDSWGYGYTTPSNHEATSETDPNGNTANATYSSFGQLTSETLYDGTSTTSINSAQSNGLLAPGDSGVLSTNYDASVTDPNGQTTTLDFNWMSHPTEEQAPNGGLTTITYNSQGFPVSETDAMGRTVDYTYNSAGDVTSITKNYLQLVSGVGFYIDPKTTITYGAYGVPTSITDYNGLTTSLTTFVLDCHGNVLEEEQPGGVDEEWTYNSAGQVLTYTDADEATTTYSYDDRGRISELQEPGAGAPTIEYEYVPFFDVTIVGITDPDGNVGGYAYNAMGEVIEEANALQGANGTPIDLSYDGDGNLTSVTDANGNTTSYSYNARDELIAVTDAIGNTTSYGYDATGNVTTVTDAIGNTSTYSYTSENEVYTISDPTVGTTTYGYDLDGEVTSVTDPNGKTATYSYSSLGLPFYASEPVGGSEVQVAEYEYDGDGNLVRVVNGDNDSTYYNYNALDELTSVKNADGDITSYTYDGDGDVLTVTDGLGHTTSYTYNDMGQVLTETQPSGGGTTSYGYDLAGLLISVTDPDDNTTTYAYDSADEVVGEDSPTGGLTTYTYDPMGNLLTEVDPDGNEIDYSYDADNELTSETWDNPEGGTPLDVINFTYNADGELTAVSDDNSAYEYTYNDDGELTSQSDAGSPDLPTVTLTYDYDADGNRTSMDDSLGGLVSYTYDARDELTNETLSGTDLSPMAVANTYDNAGNMTGQTRYSDLAETTVVAATSYTYDAANQMTGITDKSSGGTTLVSYGYSYNAAGLVSQEARTWTLAGESESDTLNYGYTANDQLTSVTHTNDSFINESFSYDANGNETGTGYTTSTGNEQTASPGYTYTYDADGNMITSTQTSTGDTWTYSYNFRGQMTGAIETNSEDTAIEHVTYTYDALGNRIGIDDNGTQTWTLYDGTDPIMDFNGSGSLETRYVNGPIGQLVDTVLGREQVSEDNAIAWYLPDRLGTVRDLINNLGGIIDHVDYTAFGTVLDESDASAGDRIMGFAGMERGAVAGLNVAIYRVQSPSTGRWTSQDPLGFGGGDSDVYRYIGNDPGAGMDTTGLAASGAVVVGPRLGHPPASGDWLDILKTPFVQQQMNQLWQDHRGHPNHWETGLWVVWNPTTCQIGVTKSGVELKGPHKVRFNHPNTPGWIPIGTLHTHSGSGSGSGTGLSPSEGDLYPSPGAPLYPGATVNRTHYKPYFPGRDPVVAPAVPCKASKRRATP